MCNTTTTSLPPLLSLPFPSLSHTHTHTLPYFQGCSAPLVVKVADTEKEKNAKRIQAAMVGMDGVGNMGLNAALGSIQAAAKVISNKSG